MKRELQVAMVEYMRENLPHLLECKVEKLMQESGHSILLTPPYCPQLQPIETFWAAGKNFVALCHYGGRTMKETINHLWYGWYVNKHLFNLPDDTPSTKYPPHILIGKTKVRYRNLANCVGMVKMANEFANGKFMELVDGISGNRQSGDR